MTSKNLEENNIHEKLAEIIHNFTREIILNKPKDILDFSIKYFYSLEKRIPFSYNPNLLEPLESNNNSEKKDLIQDNKKLNKESDSIHPLFYIQNINQGINNPINSEESRNSNQTNGRGNEYFSKNVVNEIIEEDIINKESNYHKEAFLNEKNENNYIPDKNEEEFNKTGETFNNISGGTEDKDEIRNFIGNIMDIAIKSSLKKNN